MTDMFLLGVADAEQDRDTGFGLPLIILGESLYDDRYFDGYTSQWFPLPSPSLGKDDIGVTQTWRDFLCGNRKDLPKAQRRHDWVSLGIDTANKMEKGICEVLVFACTRCGRDWRG